MDKKQLQNLLKNYTSINYNLQKLKNQLKNEDYNIKALSYDKIPSVGQASDPILNEILKREARQKDIELKISNLEFKRDRIEAMLYLLPTEQRTVIKTIYIENGSIVQLETALYKSRSTLYRWHDKALQTILEHENNNLSEVI